MLQRSLFPEWVINIYVTVPGKTDHFVIISDFEILVPRSSALFTLCNGEVRIAIAYTVLK